MTENILEKAKLINQTASLFWQMHQFNQALENFEMARDLAQRGNSPEQTINAQLGIALIYWTQGAYKKANREAKSARRLARAGSNRGVQGRLAAVSGVIAEAEGKYLAADKFFLKAARHYTGNFFITAQIALNRGLCFQHKKYFGQALKQYRKAEDLLLRTKVKETEIAQIEMLRSSAYYQMGDLTNSAAALKRAAALIAKKPTDLGSQAFFETSLGRLYLSLGKKRDAKKTLTSAAHLWKKVGVPRVEINVRKFF